MTALKSVLFFIFVPGLLLGYLPYSIALSDAPLFVPGPLAYLAFLLWPTGSAMILWCFWDFTFTGRGTPAPFDPPRELVVSGLYRYTRNPIYAGGLLVLLGWAVWSPSLPLLVAPLLFFAVAHLFVLAYEEPTLQRKFGTSYENYLREVPRWIPRSRPATK
jgi:protein-S-isoprenylcysteine O-methyltransferase Ste14